jgi:hypothetical protein
MNHPGAVEWNCFIIELLAVIFGNIASNAIGTVF